MKLLILGGTKFLGRHLAEMALARGDEVTLVHRGQTGAGLFPQAQHLIVDRNLGLTAAVNAAPRKGWDACIDTSAYFPRQVRLAAAALDANIGRYVFVSTISVYSGFAEPGMTEDAPTAVLSDPSVEVVNGDNYGGLKRLCEEAALAAFGARCLVGRPGLIVGPFDPTGRFTYWPQRVARGGTVLAPGLPTAPVQFIDVRDLAAWLLHHAEAGTQGIFNLTGPATPLTMGELLDTARAKLNPAATLRWVDEAWLLGEGVKPWSELPIWLPPDSAALHQIDIGRALATGLSCRPLAQTLADTAAWAAGRALPAGTGLSPQREGDLLARAPAAA